MARGGVVRGRERRVVPRPSVHPPVTQVEVPGSAKAPWAQGPSLPELDSARHQTHSEQDVLYKGASTPIRSTTHSSSCHNPLDQEWLPALKKRGVVFVGRADRLAHTPSPKVGDLIRSNPPVSLRYRLYTSHLKVIYTGWPTRGKNPF